jgi:hypothetical protein
MDLVLNALRYLVDTVFAWIDFTPRSEVYAVVTILLVVSLGVAFGRMIHGYMMDYHHWRRVRRDVEERQQWEESHARLLNLDEPLTAGPEHEESLAAALKLADGRRAAMSATLTPTSPVSPQQQSVDRDRDAA